MPSAEFLTIPEAALLLRIGVNQAYTLARLGELPGALRLGRTWRVRADLLHGRENGGPDIETAADFHHREEEEARRASS